MATALDHEKFKPTLYHPKVKIRCVRMMDATRQTSNKGWSTGCLNTKPTQYNSTDNKYFVDKNYVNSEIIFDTEVLI